MRKVKFWIEPASQETSGFNIMHDQHHGWQCTPHGIWSWHFHKEDAQKEMDRIPDYLCDESVKEKIRFWVEPNISQSGGYDVKHNQPDGWKGTSDGVWSWHFSESKALEECNETMKHYGTI